MHAFRIASREGWKVIADASSATAPTLVSDVAGRWLDYADRASTAFAEGHTTAGSEQLRRLDARRLALVADLLSAPDEAGARTVASAHGLRLASSYLPVVIHDADDSTESRVEAVVPLGTMLGRRTDHILVLLEAAATDNIAKVLASLGALGCAAHGRPAAVGPDLLREVVQTESVLSVAVRLGRDGLRGPDDLALHRAAREHDGLHDHLRRNVLEPLGAADPDGVFMQTLVAYLDAGAIRAVADDLFVHVNTVTYRLRRVREITGLDPRVPTQAASLVLAVALARLDPSTSSSQDQP